MGNFTVSLSDSNPRRNPPIPPCPHSSLVPRVLPFIMGSLCWNNRGPRTAGASESSRI